MKRQWEMYILLSLCFGCSLVRAQTEGENDRARAGNIILNFIHQAGEQNLYFDSTYLNFFGEAFTVRKFRYYISNIIFKNTQSGLQHSVADGYFLVDESKPASKTLSFKIPSGQYNAVSFLLGVDSLKNVSGAQTGALDPLNDMFWTWNTGYVMAKLEGSSPVSKLPHRMIEYHIGGYSGANKVLQNILLPFPQGQLITITDNKTTTLNIVADVYAWFHGKNELKIADHPACTSMGPLAKQFSDNYSQMFIVRSIQ